MSLKPLGLGLLGFLMLFFSVSCNMNKRSKCPAYSQSDPKKIFGQQTLEENLKEMDDMPTKQGQKVPGLGKKKKRRPRLF